MATVFGKKELPNLVTNGNISNDATGWTTVAGTITASAEQAYSPTESLKCVAAGSGAYVLQGIALINDNILYVSCRYYVSQYTSGSILLQAANSVIVEASPVVGTWTKMSYVAGNINQGGAANTLFIGALSGTMTVYIDNIIVIDLTARFGAGNEPSLAWCDAKLAPFVIY